jgi:inner membrane transporter RhtA
VLSPSKQRYFRISSFVAACTASVADAMVGVMEQPRGVPPHAYFVIGAAFHYLGPACAVLLFARIGPLGTAWLRITTAALVFAVWKKPWRYVARLDVAGKLTALALGVVLASMNATFYEAIARLPLGTVGAIEFIGPVALAAAGVRTLRHVAALCTGVAGVLALTRFRLVGEPLGYAFAFANCALFTAYITLGHRVATGMGVDGVGTAMIVAAVVALPFGIADAAPAFGSPALLGAAVFVGIASSVIPYVCDQLAMARLPRATFSLLLALLPATALVMGVLVLHQIPTLVELVGFAAVILAVALHGRAVREDARA